MLNKNCFRLPDEKDMDATQLENNKSLRAIMEQKENVRIDMT